MIARALFAATISLALSVMTVASPASQSQTPLAGLPPVAEGKLFNSDWGHEHEKAASQRFTAVLQHRFLAGSSEVILKRTLLAEGFKFAPPAKPGCVSEKDMPSQALGKSFVPCPHLDPNHHLRYVWTPHELPIALRPYCNQVVGVIWDAEKGKLTSIKGYYGGDCV